MLERLYFCLSGRLELLLLVFLLVLSSLDVRLLKCARMLCFEKKCLEMGQSVTLAFFLDYKRIDAHNIRC